MKKILKISIVLLIIATATFTIQHFLFSNASSEAGVLISSKVTKDTLSTTISCTGNLEPVDEVEVGTQVSGDINKLFVDYNSTVKKGQILAMLDKSKLQSAVYQAKIAYASAKNDYEYDTSVYNRTKKLAETNSASTSELEKAKYDMEAAKLNVEKSKSDVSQAQLDLSYCNIKSPIDGIVLERDVDVGQTVSASTSAPTLFILARDLTQMQLLAAVDEADIGSVKKGQRVSFTVDAFLNDLFKELSKKFV